MMNPSTPNGEPKRRIKNFSINISVYGVTYLFCGNIGPKIRWHPMTSLRTILALMIVMMCIVLTTGCTSQPSAMDKTTPKPPNTDPRQPLLFPDPNLTPYVPGGNQLLIGDFSRFLAEWNDKMHWGYSPQQIENYSRTLEDGVLRKYKKFPDYPTLDIPDMKPFCLEVGDAMGLSKNQSEAFAIAADDDLRRAKLDFMQRGGSGT
jgi:hypothetical protein